MAEQITLTIDNQMVSVPAGTLIVDAAKLAGVDVPVFCYHPKMEPVGMCRMCLVEVGRPLRNRTTGELEKNEDGTPKISMSPKLETACTTPVTPGMVVLTDTAAAKLGRKEILEFLLTSHPLDCPVCDKGGECALQNLTMEHGPGQSRFIVDEKKHLAKQVPLGELIFLDRERCIQCARCVRFEHDVVDDPVIHFFNRGRSLEIRTYSDPGFDSIFSGNTTDICPVGALTTSDFRFGARPWEMTPVASICTHCAVGCNMTYNVRREAMSGGKTVIKRAMPRQNEQVNEIWLCDKGRLGYHFVESAERLHTPLMRKDGKLVPVSWEEAYQRVEDQLRAEQARLVTLAGGRLSNEDLFNLAQFTQSQNGKAVLYSQMFGGDLTAQVGLGVGSDFGQMGVGTVILVVACDLHQEAPLWWLRVKQAVERGATLIVVNGRPTRLDKFASHVVRYAYGEEAAALAAFMPASGFGTPASEAAAALAAAQNGVVIYGSDGLGLVGSEHVAKACAKLVMERGFYGKPNNGLLAAWDKANTQGAWELGFHPDRNLKGTLREADVLLVAGADPAGDHPVLADALRETDFVVVYELFMTATAELADVVFPVLAQPEREGSFTSAERRAQRYGVVVTPLEGARPDYSITAQLARQLGLVLEEKSPVLVMKRIAEKTPAYHGVSYTTMAQTAPQWPLMGRNDLYYAGTGYDNNDGLGVQLPSAADRGEQLVLGALILADGPQAVNTGLKVVPVTRLYDRGRMLMDSHILDQRRAAQVLQMHPKLADKFALKDGDRVKLSGAGWEMESGVQLDESLSEDAALVARSNGIPVASPVYIQIQRLVLAPEA
ncbi:MAG: NADH dehydrogenase (quinone) subunit G [Chloroflexi bacterium HGW-Chloroflexi-10]|nr:MAG: NADH dehydrogenase (quinone) subunit G [Chloroflexi bacterium HGW-Chloroflexi-10]